jgi:hypothetical protein
MKLIKYLVTFNQIKILNLFGKGVSNSLNLDKLTICFITFTLK